MSEDSQVTLVQSLIDRLRRGDQTARTGLIELTFDRLTRLARAMLRDYPGVHRWEQTDDIRQGAWMRLHRALGEVTPPTPRDFFQLAAAQVRRELIDLARRYAGPQGLRKNQETHDPEKGPGPTDLAADETHNPARLIDWSALHEQAGRLPEDTKAAFDLIYYQGLTQAEAAEVLGVSERQLKRYWRDARLALHDALGGHFAGV